MVATELTGVAEGGYRSLGGLWVNAKAEEALGAVDTVIFDLDGVLMDVREAIHVVGSETVQFYVERFLGWDVGGALYLTAEEVSAFKVTPGFNDDLTIMQAALLLLLVKARRSGCSGAEQLRRMPPSIAEFTGAIAAAGGGWSGVERVLLHDLDAATRAALLSQCDEEKLLQISREFWAGDAYCREMYGFDPEYVHVEPRILRDRPLLDRSRLPVEVKHWGVFTGRLWSETKPALQRLGLEGIIPQEHAATMDIVPVKPDPTGLFRLLRRFGSCVAVFVGDMPDDRRAVRRYRDEAGPEDATLLDCLVRTGPVGEQSEEVIRSAGADIVAPDVNALLDAVGDAIRGGTS